MFVNVVMDTQVKSLRNKQRYNELRLYIIVYIISILDVQKRVIYFKTTGSSGEINIDECADKPWLYGNCLDGVASFTCECKKGYEGELCDMEIDECDRYEPCGDHGKCTGTFIFRVNSFELDPY